MRDQLPERVVPFVPEHPGGRLLAAGVLLATLVLPAVFASPVAGAAALTNGSVTPPAGTTQTTFAFSVDYVAPGSQRRQLGHRHRRAGLDRAHADRRHGHEWNLDGPVDAAGRDLAGDVRSGHVGERPDARRPDRRRGRASADPHSHAHTDAAPDRQPSSDRKSATDGESHADAGADSASVEPGADPDLRTSDSIRLTGGIGACNAYRFSIRIRLCAPEPIADFGRWQ